MEADGLNDWYACGVCRFTVDTDGDILAIRFFKGSRYHPPPSTHYLLSLLTPDLSLDVAVRARRATRAASMTRTPESYSRPPAALTSPAAQVTEAAAHRPGGEVKLYSIGGPPVVFCQLACVE